MANERSFPHAHNHVSSTEVGQSPAILSYPPTDQYGVNTVIEHCPCAVCTGSAPNGTPTWYTMDHQDWDTRSPSVSTPVPRRLCHRLTVTLKGTYTNQDQGVSHPTGAPLTVPVLSQTHFAPSGVQEQDNPAPSQQTAGIPQTLVVDPTTRISVAEGLRRLADRYINDPASLVNVVRLEPGPSSGFQVVIILEIANLL
ncbi:hypothetical protein H4582DRAFT_2063565 [Lactarius indigo]|nr:hypothetical protein H4582DRAFT_2063565 [Lactarius indigo]